MQNTSNYIFFCFPLCLLSWNHVSPPAACQYGWPPAALPDPCRSGDARHEEPSSAQVHRRTRRHRTIFTEEQLDALEELFLQNQYPDVNTREKLAQSAHLREERVEVRSTGHGWFSVQGWRGFSCRAVTFKISEYKLLSYKTGVAYFLLFFVIVHVCVILMMNSVEDWILRFLTIFDFLFWKGIAWMQKRMKNVRTRQKWSEIDLQKLNTGDRC